MKVIFIDIDGVLNNEYSIPRADGHARIERGKLQRLIPIVEDTGAKIVLTSSWKNYRNSEGKKEQAHWKQLTGQFYRYGMEVYDVTPNVPDRQRGAEIIAWLEEHKDTDSFIIIDDVMFSDYNDPQLADHVYLVKNNNKKDYGLRNADIQPIIAHLVRTGNAQQFSIQDDRSEFYV